MALPLFQWFEAQGGTLAPGLSLKLSPLGGQGLFLEQGCEVDELFLALPLKACLSSEDPSVRELPLSSPLGTTLRSSLSGLARQGEWHAVRLFRLAELLAAHLKDSSSLWAIWWLG